MKNILITGGTGFIGKNIIPIISQKYTVFAPKRNELNLLDYQAVYNYILKYKIEIIIHAANPNPVKNGVYDKKENFLNESLKMFFNLYQVSKLCEKMLYIGSGAEFNKSSDIVSIKENFDNRLIPEDDYGLAKYIMNDFAQKSSNVYNLRMFACYGDFDHYSKFITHAIRCCLNEEAVTIRQNCYFDYLHISDFTKVLLLFIENTPHFHDYNVCSGNRYSLYEIAELVCKKMNNTKEIQILKSGLNFEYTANNDRLIMELHHQCNFLSLSEGIDIQIVYERERFTYEKN